jgi:hypothetical protein
MALSAKSKMLNRVSAVYLSRTATSSPISTTIGAGGAAVGVTNILVTSSAGVTANDIFRVGEGEEMELVKVQTVPDGTHITIFDGLVKDHVATEPVVKQTVYDLGDVDDGGVTPTWSGEQVDLLTSTRRLPLATLPGFITAGAEFVLPTYSLYNMAIALGMPFANVTGTGTTADPFAIVTDGNEFATEQNQSLIVIATLMDGTFLRYEFWGVDFDYTGIAFRLALGQAAKVPCKAVASAGGILTTNANPYVPSVTFRPTKNEVWLALSEVGLFSDAGSPAATTVSVAGAAGGNSFTLTAGTGLAVGDWLRFGTSDTIEYHQIDTINTGTGVGTTRDFFLRTQAITTPVSKQTLTAISGIAPDGVNVQIAGSFERLRDGTKRLDVGGRPGNAVTTVSFGVTRLDLPTYCRALGIPQSAISGGKVLFGSNIGTSDIDGVYVRGVNKGGKTCWLVLWGASSVLQQINTALAGTGQAQIPIAVRPSSGIQFLQS